MSDYHGKPCWYELGTSDLEAGQAFYSKLFGWDVVDAGMEGFDYRLARSGEDLVAGLMSLGEQSGTPLPNWTIYIAVDDCDATTAAVKAARGKAIREPADIPGTGRFAVLADPQGAVFGILQPDPMPDGGAGHAFSQMKTGHGNWHELMTTDPGAASGFYSGIFGWTKGRAVEINASEAYQVFRYDGDDIGGMMGLSGALSPAWLAYFGVASVDAAMNTVTAEGGTVQHGPVEVPGPALIAICTDPQGAWFALVGPKP